MVSKVSSLWYREFSGTQWVNVTALQMSSCRILLDAGITFIRLSVQDGPSDCRELDTSFELNILGVHSTFDSKVHSTRKFRPRAQFDRMRRLFLCHQYLLELINNSSTTHRHQPQSIAKIIPSLLLSFMQPLESSGLHAANGCR